MKAGLKRQGMVQETKSKATRNNRGKAIGFKWTTDNIPDELQYRHFCRPALASVRIGKTERLKGVTDPFKGFRLLGRCRYC